MANKRQAKAEHEQAERPKANTICNAALVRLFGLPALPDDDVIACNKDITWTDVLAMTKADIDYVYKTWQAIGDDILLRLKRAAGYHRRVA
jgi:hypothetical protein